MQDLRHEHVVCTAHTRPTFETMIDITVRVLEWPDRLVGMLTVQRTKYSIDVLREVPLPFLLL